VTRSTIEKITNSYNILHNTIYDCSTVSRSLATAGHLLPS